MTDYLSSLLWEQCTRNRLMGRGKLTENTPLQPSFPCMASPKMPLPSHVDAIRPAKGCTFTVGGYYILGDDKKNNSIFCKLLPRGRRRRETFPFTTGKNKYDCPVGQVGGNNRAPFEITGIINCCTGQPISLAERVEQFIQEHGLKIKLEYGCISRPSLRIHPASMGIRVKSIRYSTILEPIIYGRSHLFLLIIILSISVHEEHRNKYSAMRHRMRSFWGSQDPFRLFGNYEDIYNTVKNKGLWCSYEIGYVWLNDICGKLGCSYIEFRYIAGILFCSALSIIIRKLTVHPNAVWSSHLIFSDVRCLPIT